MAKTKAKAEPKKGFNFGSLLKRALSSLILVAITLGVIYLGSPYLEISILLIGILLAWEWSNMVPNKGTGLYMGAYSFAVAAVIYALSPLTIGLVFLTAAWVWIKSKGEKHRKLLTLGVFYIAIGAGSVAWVYQYLGITAFLWLVLIVWGMDTGGYLVGCTVRGPKLFPKISPNKTYSGLFGGFLFAAVFNCALVWYLDMMNRNAILTEVEYSVYLEELKSIYLATSLFAVMFAFIAQIGDFIESAVKRHLGVKDSSDLIPGHGGVFDRVDGLIFAAPVMFICFRVFYLINVGF